MNKTEHYQLPQWEAADPVRRGDFNDAMGAIDGGIAGALGAAGAAQTTADIARVEAGAAQNTAQAAASAAQTAQSAADAAQAAADGAMTEATRERIITGSFTVDSSVTGSTKLATFSEGAKMAVFVPACGTPAVAFPNVDGWVYLGDFAQYVILSLESAAIQVTNRSSASLSAKIWYAVIY